MSCRLVIAEKPSVAQDIAAVLGARERGDGCIRGNDWIVTWCIGHLVELAQAAAYEERFGKWRLEEGFTWERTDRAEILRQKAGL